MELTATRYVVEGRVARLTLSRPHRANAWTGRMHHEYRWAMTEAERDPDVRVVVVTGAAGQDGRSSFCVGADARALEAHADAGAYDDGLGADPPPMPDVDNRFAADFAFQLGMRTPIVAAVNGPAAGVGLAVACFADIRFAVTGAKLTTAAPTLGFPAEYGLSWILPRLVGAGPAAEWLLTGRVVTTDEAAGAGLFAEVVADVDALAGRVDTCATDFARHISPASVAVTKRQLWGELVDGAPASSVRRSTELFREMAAGPDFAEGARALTERRRPEF